MNTASHKLGLRSLDDIPEIQYNKKAVQAIERQTERKYAELSPAGFQRRKRVMYMTGYEIAMICIAAMTLLLKLIEVIINLLHK